MLWRCSSHLRQTALFRSFQRRVQAPRFRWHNHKQSSTWIRHGLPKKNLQQFGLSRANMSVGFASDPRGKVVISVGLAACLIGGIGYIKYTQQQTSVSQMFLYLKIYYGIYFYSKIKCIFKTGRLDPISSTKSSSTQIGHQ